MGAVKLLDDAVTGADDFVKGVVFPVEVEVASVGEEPLLVADHGKTRGWGRASG